MSQPTTSDGHKTMSLDYVSTSRPGSIWQALKNKDIIVVASGLASLFVSLLIVVSTDLFALTNIPGKLDQVSYTTTAQFINNASGLDSLSMLPVYIMNAVDIFNLTYPSGTTAEVAYQPFISLDLPSDAIRQATVDVMTYDLDCEPAELIVHEFSSSWRWKPCWMTEGDVPSVNASVTFVTSSCSINPGIRYSSSQSGEIQTYTIFGYDYCDRKGDYDDVNNIRVAIAIGRAQQSGTVGPDPTKPGCNNTAPLAKINVLNAKQWLCKQSLSIVKGNVTFNTTYKGSGAVPEITLDPDAEHRTLPNVSMSDLISSIYALGADGYPYSDPRLLPIQLSENNTELQIPMILRERPGVTLEELLNTDILANLTRKWYKRILAQVTHQVLIAEDNSPVIGTAIVNENRLIVRVLPLRLMETILGLLILLCIIMLITHPSKPAVPRDVATLAGLAAVLAPNSSMLYSFHGTGAWSEVDLQKLTGIKRYKTKFNTEHTICPLNQRDWSFHIQETSKEAVTENQNNAPLKQRADTSWWRPFVITKTSRTSIFFLIIVAIVALQVVLSYSNRHQGLTDVGTTGYLHLSWSFVPACVMMTIAFYFDSLASVYQIFAPYCHLRAGSDARSSLYTNYLALTGIEVLWSSLRMMDYTVFLITISTTLATSLTIVISGVFSITPVPSSHPVSLRQQTWFKNDNPDDDGSAGNSSVIARLVVDANLSYPKWTYNNLVFPTLEIKEESLTISSATSLRTQIPAIRSSLNCTIYKQYEVPDTDYYFAAEGRAGGSVRSRMPGPADCAGANPQMVSYIPVPDSPFGGFLTNNITHCPPLNYFWGSVGKVNVTHIVALSCYERIERLEVDTKFVMPGFQIDKDTSPQPREETVNTFSSSVLQVPYKRLPRLQYKDGFNDLSGFYEALTSSGNIKLSDLSNPNKTEEISRAIEDLHRVIRAQQYHAALREPATDSVRSQNLIGTLTNPHLRLVQNTISTHVLSCLLGAMLVCASMASWLMSTKFVLPKNPCTIAAMMSLLADSNIFEKGVMPEGAEWMSDKELKRREVFKGMKFKMGWFDRESDGQQIFTINSVDDRPGKHE